MNELKNKKIAVIAGGPSEEREISFKSAKSVLESLHRQGFNAFLLDPLDDQFFSTEYDIAFNCMHGKWGEDGTLQGYLDIKGIPYTGPGVLATSIGFNKPIFKSILSTLEIPTAQIVNPSKGFNQPFIAKPKNNGSSIGIYIIKSAEEWKECIRLHPEVLTNDYFYESYIPGREITIGVIEKDHSPMVLPILEIESTNEFYDYEGKYTPGKSRLFEPSDIDETIVKQVKDIALMIYRYFNCKGCIRIDIIFNENGPFVLEMNTSPGLTQLSDIPAQAKLAGMSFDELMYLYLQSTKLECVTKDKVII